MPQSYYVVHIERENDKLFNDTPKVTVQLRRFAYAGCFASSIHDEFSPEEYGVTLKKEYTVSDKEEYQSIIKQCKKIFIKRNPNIDPNRIQ